MINIRHHIASIIGIFCALAVGLVIGATFISGETIEALEARLDAQEADLDDTQGESDSLQGRVDELEALADRFESAAPAHVFEGRLEGESVLVVAPAGTDSASTDTALSVLGHSAATIAGVLTIESPIDPASVDALAATLVAPAEGPVPTTLAPTTVPPTTSTPPPTTTADPTPDELPTLEELEAFLNATTTLVPTTTLAPTTTTSTSADQGGAALDTLLDTGGATYDARSSEVPRASRVIVVVDQGSDPEVESSLIALLRAINASDAPGAIVVATDATQPIVAAIRDDVDLALAIPTVSHFEGVIGQLAAVLAAEDLSVPFIEHYGAEEALLLLPPGEL